LYETTSSLFGREALNSDASGGRKIYVAKGKRMPSRLRGDESEGMEGGEQVDTVSGIYPD
jgi:hypothetical protein